MILRPGQRANFSWPERNIFLGRNKNEALKRQASVQPKLLTTNYQLFKN